MSLILLEILNDIWMVLSHSQTPFRNSQNIIEIIGFQPITDEVKYYLRVYFEFNLIQYYFYYDLYFWFYQNHNLNDYREIIKSTIFREAQCLLVIGLALNIKLSNIVAFSWYFK